MDYWQFAFLRFAKFCAIMSYAFGVGVGLGPFDLGRRKQAVHFVASPALLVVWLAGYTMTFFTGVALTELWVLLGLSLSLVGHVLLSGAARKLTVPKSQRALVLLFMAGTLALMVFRPTWSRLGA